MGKRLLVVGGDAAGMSATVQARRLAPDLEIVVVEKGRWTSYSACGIPHLASGAVRAPEDLVVRSAEEFRNLRIDVRTGHEVGGIDLDARRAEVHNLTHGRSFHLGFDFLLLATGARPIRPEVPGADLDHVHAVRTLEDGARLADQIHERRPQKVVVLGSSAAGLELAAAFQARGAAVTVLEAGSELLPLLDGDMAPLVARALRDAGVTVEAGVTVTAIHEAAVATSRGDIAADLVVLGAGVAPCSELGRAAGLEVGIRNGLVVDRRQRTSAEGIWAAGDCCQSIHRVSGTPTYQATGSVAAKQGRVAGINLGGGYATFPGVLGTAVAQVCGLEFGRTGLTAVEAERAGFATVSATVHASTAETYLAVSRPVTVKMVAEEGSGRILGVQTAGGPGSAKRVDVVATAVAAGLGVEDLLGLDLGYDPVLTTVWDPLQTAARSLAARAQLPGSD